MESLKLTVLIVLLLAMPGIVPAQPAPESPGVPEPPDTTRLEEARAALEAARAELERAAGEVAQLSAEQYASFAGRRFPGSDYFRFRRPWLGLNINNDEDGVRVIGVSPGGPGEAAGVEIGDLIVAVNDVEVDASAGANPTRRFLDALSEVEAGSEVRLNLLRDGETLTRTVETSESNVPAWVGDIGERVNVVVRDIPGIAERNFTRVMEQPFFFGAWSDMELVELTPGLGKYFGADEGLLVVRAPDGDDIDLRDGDVILQIAGRTPQSVGHAMRILRSFEPEESLEITIMRDQRRQSVELSR